MSTPASLAPSAQPVLAATPLSRWSTAATEITRPLTTTHANSPTSAAPPGSSGILHQFKLNLFLFLILSFKNIFTLSLFLFFTLL